MNTVRLTLIALFTVVLGTIGIIICLVLPGGRALMPLVRFWSRLVLASCRVAWSASYAPELRADRPCIYVANHQSQMDIPALVLAMPVDFRMIAKRSLLYIPIFGWALWLAGFVFIDRGNRAGAIRVLNRAVTRIRGGISLVFFAEGTRSRDGSLLPFKKGAFVMALQAGVPIVPVSIAGGRAVLPKGSLRIRPGALRVAFGAPVETAGYTMETKEALISLVRLRIAEGLKRISAE